jgi:hypothetical protein
MASPCSPCNNIPFLNRCYYPAKNEIWVTMPQCQVVPGQLTPVNNPCFDGNKSYWSYNFFIETSENSQASIVSFAIPVCKELTVSQISVFEKLSNSVQYVKRPFELKSSLSKKDEFIMASEGFQYMIINIDERYSTGLSAEYRIELDGDYPEVLKDIYVNRSSADEGLIMEGSFIVPGCPPPDELSIIKNCSTSIDNNVAALNYEVIITNTGGSAARNVQLIDTIGYDGLNITIGDIKVEPENERLDITSMPSLLEIKGQLGDIQAGARVTVKYSIPVISIIRDGIFEFTNIATALNNRGVLVQSNCTIRMEAAQLAVNLNKAVNDNSIKFTIQLSGSGNYPESSSRVEGQIIIDEGLTVELTRLGNFIASSEDGTPKEQGSIVEGMQNGTKVLITNLNIPLSGGKTIQEVIELKVINLKNFNKDCQITGIIKNVVPLNTKPDIFIKLNTPAEAERIFVRSSIS